MSTSDHPVLKNLTLYIPGLLSPLKSGATTIGTHKALETILTRAQKTHPNFPKSYDEGLFALFNLSKEESSDLPVAAVTRMHDMGVIDNDSWLRADPVHFTVDRDRLVLTDARKLDVTRDEANQLVSEIMEAFKSDRWLLKAPHPERWYLKPRRPAKITTTALSQVIGHDVHGFLPTGPDEKAWHALLNELQILLHTASINVEREKKGKLPINSLWFWGNGKLPRITPVTWTRIWSAEPVTLSLAKLSGTPTGTYVSGYDEWRQQTEDQGDYLVVLNEILEASLYEEENRRSEILKQLESSWMAPILRDVQSGVLNTLTLLTTNTVNVTITSRQSRRWWQWKRSFASFCDSAA